MLRLRATLSVFLWAVSSSCISDIRCPPNPCGGSSSEHRSCSEIADWVIDGEVNFVTHGSVPYTTHFGPEVVSTRIWDGGSVVLTNVIVVKGSYPVVDESAVLQGASHCWENLARIPEKYSGQIIRAYGTNRGGFHVKPRMMAFDRLANIEARSMAETEAKERHLELKQVNSVDCRIPAEKEPSNEVFLRRGQDFFNSNAYSSAKSCFLNALKEEDNSRHYKEACYYLGMMYELGKGVDQDWGIAKDWYSKAGL
ncbi:MAG: hypothetical protein WBK19_02515 [Azonexus sp.]